MTDSPQIICLFSGGLDSLLAAKLLQRQGLHVRCLHLFSPFFGSPESVERWRRLYGLDIVCLDMGERFVTMLTHRPEHGFGKVLNPCVDCKILQLRAAREYMEATGARALATGEVLGQRPMSQRRDTLNLIKREAGVGDNLLRPLSALCLEPTAVEKCGLVDRTQLLGIYGRGRREQLALAREYALEEIPTPAGGCRLTERENARRYWAVMTNVTHPVRADFDLANLGRQCWYVTPRASWWLSVGRNSADNDRLALAVRPGDVLLQLAEVPGPLALARHGELWPEEVFLSAAAHTASYAPRAVERGRAVVQGTQGGQFLREVTVTPHRQEDLWGQTAWESIKPLLRAEARERAREAARHRR
ncbi:MAG: tRNA(5-methylaminomethyl-2-thiouridylate) methyltransferase [Desulfovibrio sp.]|nr:tRNA(5-methylaminomethyl-2-thiouridylate) methyltransferase [Desulfovibrio sp.]